jgi:hypothetical protein
VKSNLDFLRDFFCPLGLSPVKEREGNPEARVENFDMCHVEGR